MRRDPGRIGRAQTMLHRVAPCCPAYHLDTINQPVAGAGLQQHLLQRLDEAKEE